VGIAQDLSDFPFIELLGLSSYPYFVFADPDDIPLDYYARLRAEAGKPVLVVEGGWTSSTVGGIVSSAETQRRYIARQARLLDQAEAELVVQLTFTDLDLSVYPPSVGPFAFLGLVNTSLVPKPALQTWDSLFAVPRHGFRGSPADRRDRSSQSGAIKSLEMNSHLTRPEDSR
jgi:hypothetical protein